MGQAIYFADPVVAVAYHTHPGEFAWVADPVEVAWLLTNRHGYSLSHRGPLPPAYYVHPDAPLPFVPFPGGTPRPGPSPEPAPPAPAPEPSPPPAEGS